MSPQVKQKAKEFWWLPLIIFLFVQLTTAVWWASSINSAIKYDKALLDKEICNVKDHIKSVRKNVDEKFLSVQKKLEKIDEKLDRILLNNH